MEVERGKRGPYRSTERGRKKVCLGMEKDDELSNEKVEDGNLTFSLKYEHLSYTSFRGSVGLKGKKGGADDVSSKGNCSACAL